MSLAFYHKATHTHTIVINLLKELNLKEEKKIYKTIIILCDQQTLNIKCNKNAKKYK
jgi:hypothetical protein